MAQRVKRTVSGLSGSREAGLVGYGTVLDEVVTLIEVARNAAVRSAPGKPGKKGQTASARSSKLGPEHQGQFPLPWSHYVRLLAVENPEARAFYEVEALRGGWTVRQLDRQVSTLFYERAALSKTRPLCCAAGRSRSSSMP